MKKVMISILSIMLTFAFVTGEGLHLIDGRTTLIRDSLEDRLMLEGKIEGLRENLQERQQLSLGKIGINVTRENGILLMDQNKERIRTRLNMTVGENGTALNAILSNGRNAEIKLMPSTASEIALERLRMKVCTVERNCTIELKEVASKEGGNQTQLVYEARLNKQFKVFGVFKTKKQVMAQVDAENGDVVKTQKPWWSFLATEEKELQ